MELNNLLEQSRKVDVSHHLDIVLNSLSGPDSDTALTILNNVLLLNESVRRNFCIDPIISVIDKNKFLALRVLFLATVNCVVSQDITYAFSIIENIVVTEYGIILDEALKVMYNIKTLQKNTIISPILASVLCKIGINGNQLGINLLLETDSFEWCNEDVVKYLVNQLDNMDFNQNDINSVIVNIQLLTKLNTKFCVKTYLAPEVKTTLTGKLISGLQSCNLLLCESLESLFLCMFGNVNEVANYIGYANAAKILYNHGMLNDSEIN